MKEKQSDFIAWIKAHKKQLVFSGVSVVTIIGVITQTSHTQKSHEAPKVGQKRNKKIA